MQVVDVLKIGSNKIYSCKLYTLDGVKDATASDLKYDEYRKYFTWKIKANDNSYAIRVREETVEHKFYYEECPTFYAC